MKTLSWLGLTLLTLAHAFYLPATDDSLVNTPPPTPADYGLGWLHGSDLPATDDSLVSTPPPTPADYGLDWLHGTDHHNPFGFTCPEGWTMHSTQCLLFVAQNMTWVEARDNCASKGHGSLAAVYDSTQVDEISEEMKKAGLHGGTVWVGGSKTSGDPDWSWDYSIMDQFAEFCSGEPADDENCLQITFNEKNSGCLEAQRCDMQLPSVCAILLY
ncbi:type-2 ice-structuring protein-like isoform X1 [Cyprinodon tularosa]|uniref:type-2 ice-structuring protein-like isoform X1 n=1 Tax=Cyprinodon tularosa TaxID=77115 RepID=UPI0018E22322|nr:type-2 ice-structuring protein-like isoform X1 [Cyprinodon tularosa]XP_038139629.1 type-2 ice-structuring protein-like isoform X1 [Cyprinodon tularosa]